MAQYPLFENLLRRAEAFGKFRPIFNWEVSRKEKFGPLLEGHPELIVGSLADPLPWCPAGVRERLPRVGEVRQARRVRPALPELRVAGCLERRC